MRNAGGRGGGAAHPTGGNYGMNWGVVYCTVCLRAGVSFLSMWCLVAVAARAVVNSTNA
jgi:hypothetical protein